MESTLKFQRGDIYFVRLDSSTGSEQNGTRPAVILQNDVGNTHSPTLIVATLTSKTEKKAAQPTHCLVEPEKLEPSIVQAEQIFTIDKSRVQNFVGHLTPEEMSRVDDAVKISLALNPMGSIQKLKPIIRSAAAYAPPEVVDGKPPVYPYTPIRGLRRTADCHLSEQCWIPCPLWKVLASGQLARNGRQPDLHGRSPLRRCPLRIDARTPDHPAGGV